MRRQLATTLAITLLAACATDRATEPKPRDVDASATPTQKRALRAALLTLEPSADEPFAAYVTRAKSSLSSHPGAEVLPSLPDDAAALLAGPTAELGVVLLGTWARSRHRAARVDALASLIRHPTINPSDVEVPGRTPAFDAFEADLQARAEALGLRFDHVDHVAYEVSAGDAEDAVGVLVHADVVPASEPGWSVEPFAGVVQDGKVLGRGALDDKGPLVAVLYALDALADSGAPLEKRAMLIIGTSEETHWEGIERYQKARGLPDALFVADGAFPVGVGEKGITTVRVTTEPAPATAAKAKGPGALLVELYGGEAANQVPSSARAVVAPVGQSAADLARHLTSRAAGAKDMRLTVREEQGRVVVEAAGEAAHGAVPAEGHNALSDLLRFLTTEASLVETPCVALLAVVDERLGTGVSGEGLGVGDAHPRFTPSTVNLGTARSDEKGACTLALNIRWPPPRTEQDVVASVRRSLEEALAKRPGGPYPLQLENGGLDPFLAAAEGPLVRSLVDAYEHVTGEEGAPVTLAGTTYAKAAPGSVTFGPGREGSSDIHAANEHITLDELDDLTETYTVALARLAIARER